MTATVVILGHHRHDPCNLPLHQRQHLNIFLYPVQGGYLVEDAKVTWNPTRGSAVHVQETFHLLFVKSGSQVQRIKSPHQRPQAYS